MGNTCSNYDSEQPLKKKKRTLVKTLTKENFRSCLLALTKLPRNRDENMLEGLKKLKSPELFQIYQIYNNDDKPTYNYRHYEVNTHKILIDIINIDPFSFEFSNPYENKTIELIYGEDGIYF
jgi:hypothetical protein